MNLSDVLETTKKEPHCGLCKIDFLGTGVCSAGKKHGFVAYWPEGRMELARALAENEVEPSVALLDVVNSCNLCGVCDRQCYFITQRRPTKAQQALKDYVTTLPPNSLKSTPEDEIVKDLRTIVGNNWATNDPIIIASYIRSIIKQKSLGKYYIVMPQTTEEIVAIVKLANKYKIPYLPRGNGTFFGVALQTLLAEPATIEQGIIIDLWRMKDLHVDPETITATIGPGVTSFELQKAAHAHKLRANVAEAESCVCANAQNLGIVTTWSNTYGWGTDNFIDAEYIDSTGTIQHLSDKDIPNPYASEQGLLSLSLIPSVIITKLTLKLHEILDDEQAVFVPFTTLPEALDLAHELAKRNIGISLAVLSRKYLTEFISPTHEIAEDFNFIAEKYLKLNYVVDVICDAQNKKIVEELAEVSFDHAMLKSLILGSSKLASMKESSLLKTIAEEENPLKAVFGGPMRKHFEKGLASSPQELAKVFPEDLRDFFEKLYSKPELTNPVWLHSFRILPCRMERKHMWMYRGGYMPGDKKTILKVIDALEKPAQTYNIDGAFGFLSYLERGKLAHLEYDYYYDHTDPDARKRVNKAIVESWRRQFAIKGVTPLEFICSKGLHRKEHILYPFLPGLSEEELEHFEELIETLFGGEDTW
ncbi:D-lactate dehydrogenase (acceptor) [uncultured archaeon]|nr:D-lactate dehydrogenase (acceptor) [uncultured archaeon]